MSRRVVLGAVVLGMTLAVLSRSNDAQAEEPGLLAADSSPKQPQQDIAVDGSASNSASVRATATSRLVVEAERAQTNGDLLDAATLWIQVTETDSVEQRRLAEYELGVVLAQLGFLYSSIPWLRAAAEERQHPMHLAALRQLSGMADRLPELWFTLPLFSGYTLVDLDRITGLTIGEQERIAYFLGRGHYLARDFERALRAFERVGPSSSRYLEARLLESACQVRRHRSVPALTSLERGIASLDQGQVRARDPEQWLDRFNLARARIYYSSAISLDARTNVPRLNPSRLSAAVKYYDRLGPESEYFPEATFELAWLYFLAGQYTFALGKVFALDAPYYEHDFHPEALILKAVVYFANCNYDAATITSARFNKRYLPLRDDLKRLIRQFRPDQPGQFVRVVSELRKHPNALGSSLVRSVESAYRQREFLRMLLTRDEIEAEIGRLDSWTATPRLKTLVDQLRHELHGLREAAASRADQWLRSFLQHRIDEIDEHVRHAAIQLYYDIEPRRNLLDNKLKSGQVGKVESNDWGRVRGDEEHVIWPFDGEYWLDELGTYRQTVSSTCGR